MPRHQPYMGRLVNQLQPPTSVIQPPFDGIERPIKNQVSQQGFLEFTLLGWTHSRNGYEKERDSPLEPCTYHDSVPGCWVSFFI